MKKGLLITIILVIVLLIVGLIVFFGAKDKNIVEEENGELSLKQISDNIIEKSVFKEMAAMDIDKATLTSLMEIEEGQVEEVVGKFPMMNVHASMFVIIKASDGKVDEVLQKVETYATNYEIQWARYLPEQYELVKNREVGKKDNFVYMIVAENASELVKNIK